MGSKKELNIRDIPDPEDPQACAAHPEWTTNSKKLPDYHWLCKADARKLLKGLITYKIDYRQAKSKADLQKLYLKTASQSKSMKELIANPHIDPDVWIRSVETRGGPMLRQVEGCQEVDVDRMLEERAKEQEKANIYMKNTADTTIPEVSPETGLEAILKATNEMMDKLSNKKDSTENLALEEDLAKYREKTVKMMDKIKEQFALKDANNLQNEFRPNRSSSPIIIQSEKKAHSP